MSPEEHRNAVGTIPADAGEPGAQNQGQAVARDHPRGRGGTVDLKKNKYRLQGPSPRTRGNLDWSANIYAWKGTIPADAGEPHPLSKLWALPRDHPRGRGGTYEQAERGIRAGGPSPRTRGNQIGQW